MILELNENYELMVRISDPFNPLGAIFALDKALLSVSLEFHREGAASTANIEFLYDENKSVPFAPGASIAIFAGNKKLFIGTVFKTSRNRWGRCNLLAYDDLRYLKNTVFVAAKEGVPISTIISDALKDCGITNITVLPALTYSFSFAYIRYNQSAFDIIGQCLRRQTITSTVPTNYILYHDYDADSIVVTTCDTLIAPDCLITSDDLLGDYSVNASIDDDTYNEIRAVVDVGMELKEQITARSSTSSSKWGVLRKIIELPADGYQYYLKKAQETNNRPKIPPATSSLIQAEVEKMLIHYNRATYDLSFDCIGYLGLRAGQYITINIPDVLVGVTQDGNIPKSNLMLVEKVSHKFTENRHTMSVTTKLSIMG